MTVVGWKKMNEFEPIVNYNNTRVFFLEYTFEYRKE